MQRFWGFLILALSVISCDDGDLIVTNFDFSEVSVAMCSTVDNTTTSSVNYVFYKINNDTNESLSFELSTDEPILTSRSLDTPYSFNLGSSSNAISYRMYDADIASDYFCNAIPPAAPKVNEEYISQEGIVTISTTGTEDDNDGIAAEFELLLDGKEDYDGDGLPNTYDNDDDGDNVPTNAEGLKFNTDGSINIAESRDTDKDGILDYLDEDDDGDGVLTRNEDPDKDLNPANDRTDQNAAADYLNPLIAVDYNINKYRVHTYQFKNILVYINLSNIVFQNQSGDETIRQQSLDFGEYKPGPKTDTITPVFNK
tara:strand:- start:158460 stop:159398 length:939 start_codon:yes stop_codon:yes gene_type:complete